MIKVSRTLAISLVFVGLLALPAVPAAQAQTDGEVTIESLKALIDQLKAQIEALQNARNEVQATRRELTLNIVRYLQQGATGEDVTTLQEYLALDSDIYPEGLVTGYYGPLTAAAVRRFQRRHGIDQVGVVGPRTRAKLHELFADGLLPDSAIPPGLTHAPGIAKKGGVCAVPGIAKKLERCRGVNVDSDDDDDDGDDTLEFEGVVASISDTELVLEDDSTFVLNDDTEIEDGVEVGSEVEVTYEVDGDDFVALEVKLDDDEDEDEDEEEEMEVDGVVATLTDDELVLEDDTTFVINDDTVIEEGVEVGSSVEVKYEEDGDDKVATEVNLDD